jgi:hypothetical protein
MQAGHASSLLQRNIDCIFCEAAFLQAENSIVGTAQKVA